MTTKSYRLLSTDKQGDTVIIGMHIPEDLFYFDGHFEQIPVLPGVVQLTWAMELAIAHFGLRGEFRSIDVMKFTKIISPGADVFLHLEYLQPKKRLLFSYRSGDVLHSSGKIKVT